MTRLVLAVATAATALMIGAPAHAQGICVTWGGSPPWPIPKGVCAPLDIGCTQPLGPICDNTHG